LRPGRAEEPAHALLDAGAPAGRRSGDQTTVVVDTAPDFRLQAVRAEVKRVDACLFTHDHADQAHGIDDLRPFFLNARKRVPTYMDAYTTESLGRRFDYIFQSRGGYPAICDATPFRRTARPGRWTVPAARFQ
jgi:phosphoribosyl 1,2-cyclic phosphate phosphodiesterase